MQAQQFLHDRGILFEMLPHQPTFTAQSLAEAVHVSGDAVAKSVLLEVDGEFVLALVPASHHIDMHRVEWALGADHADLASEEDCGRQFADCEIGALPPFGSEYGLRTVIDRSLLDDDWIVFQANSHDSAFRLRCNDFTRLEHPLVAEISHHF